MDPQRENINEIEPKISARCDNIKDNEITVTAQKETILQFKCKLEKKYPIITRLYFSRKSGSTKPFRQLIAVVHNFRHLVVWSAQVLYNAIPLSRPIKNRITNFVFFSFGTLFRGTDSYEQWRNIKNDALKTVHLNENYIETYVEKIETYLELVPNSADKITELTFSNQEAPTVSIVIPIFNNWRYTYACLRAIRERSGDDISYEVIIANDASTDETSLMLEHINGAVVVNNHNNLGFLRNCNNAIKYAQGEYILFLNNDTEVQHNWLKPLLNIFYNFNNVGIVGGQLLYPNGRIQEAGGIICQNGWGHSYGRGEHPKYYEFNYVKEVDCIIGACLMIKKDLFLSLGGFDESFAPAFYEEFDLAFTLRMEGYKIMYQPDSKILHYESSSYGTETKNNQSIINRRKFCNKWQNVLRKQTALENGFFLARDQSYNKRIILVIDDKVPEYDRNAGGLTTYQYLSLFGDMGFKVVFFPDDLTPLAPYTNELQQLGIEVIYGGINIRKWLSSYGKYFHYIWLARPIISSKYIDLIKKLTTGKILYYTHDLHYLRERRRYEVDHAPNTLLESQRLKRLEFTLFSKADVILTPSNYEEHVIRESFPNKNVFTIPPYIYEFSPENTKTGPGFSEREGIIFLGAFNHMPNVDAVSWFVQEILPRVRARLPGVTFTVVGSYPAPEILALKNEEVLVTGYVPDLRFFFEKARVFVAPLRYGAGVKGKIVSSMMSGVPVVTTNIGNEGMDLADEQEVLIADDPEAFAQRTIELYTNRALWERLAYGGKTYVHRHFGREKARKLMEVVMSINVE